MSADLDELLDRQERVISRAQAVAIGLSLAAWRHRLNTGRWQPCGDGVAIAHSGTPEPEQLDWAAVLHCGRDAALTGDAALVRFGAKRLTVVRHDVAIPAQRRAVRRELDLLTVQPQRLRHLECWTAGHPHLPMVHVHAATLHAAAWAVDDEQAEHRLTLAVQQRLTSPISLRLVLAQMPRLPRRHLIGVVLDDVELGATAQSELDFVRFCRRHALPLPDELQLKVRASGTTRYLDGWYRKQRLSLEIDGAHHRWAAQWEADTLRSLQLAVAQKDTGERVLRVTRGMLRHHEQETAALLRQLLM